MGWEQLLTEADNWLSLLHLSVLIHNDIIITLDSIAESLGVVGYQLNPIVWVQHLGGGGSGFFRSKNHSVWFYIRTISISFHKICTFHFFKIYNIGLYQYSNARWAFLKLFYDIIVVVKVSVWRCYAALCPLSHPVWSTCAKMLAAAILQKKQGTIRYRFVFF